MYRFVPAALALAGVCALAATVPAQALAAPVTEVFSTKPAVVKQQTSIEITRSDLVSQDARIALLSRIEDAAFAVCQAQPPGGPEPTVTVEQARCRRDAIARTAWQVHDPELWAMAQDRVRALSPGF
jgi:UrcA family protein